MASRVLALLLIAATTRAQTSGPAAVAGRYLDTVTGVTLDQAIARARAQEPALRAAQTEIQVAEGMRHQASRRPNPSVSVEHRGEPAGTDRQTMVAVEWPLDLFRRTGRLAVADRDVAVSRHAASDTERRLIGNVRAAYGDVAAGIRDLTLLDELVALTQQQHDLLRARVEEGASPPLERDVLAVELRRLESDRLLQVGEVEAALYRLKPLVGMDAEEALTLRGTLEDLVGDETPADLPDSPAIDQRADVLEAAGRVEIAEARLENARREGRFDMSIFASYMRMDAGFPQQAFAADGRLTRVRGVFHYVSAGAALTIPVLNRNEGAVAAARAAQTGAAAAYDAARLVAASEAAAARAREAQARAAVALFRTGTQALARQNLTVVRQTYEAGRLTAIDVLEEQRRYLDVERAYTDALRAAYEARTARQLALGDLR